MLTSIKRLRQQILLFGKHSFNAIMLKRNADYIKPLTEEIP